MLNADTRKASFSVSAYMLELYQDDLCDLLRPPPDRKAAPEVRALNDEPQPWISVASIVGWPSAVLRLDMMSSSVDLVAPILDNEL